MQPGFLALVRKTFCRKFVNFLMTISEHDVVVPLVRDPPSDNSFPLQNPPLCQAPTLHRHNFWNNDKNLECLSIYNELVKVEIWWTYQRPNCLDSDVFQRFCIKIIPFLLGPLGQTVASPFMLHGAGCQSAGSRPAAAIRPPLCRHRSAIIMNLKQTLVWRGQIIYVTTRNIHLGNSVKRPQWPGLKKEEEKNWL